MTAEEGRVERGVEDLAGFLLGAWTLTRTIRSLDGVDVGSFVGEASFTPAPHGRVLRYEEHGTARLGDHVGPASRRLAYVLLGDGRARVTFDDGRPFHDLDLRTGRWQATHPCGPDAYEGSFEVVDADRWRQRWIVRGPAKAHALTTDLCRRSSTAPRSIGGPATEVASAG